MELFSRSFQPAGGFVWGSKEEEEERGADDEEEEEEPRTGVTLSTHQSLVQIAALTGSDLVQAWFRPEPGSGLDCESLTWDHRGQRSWDRRARSSIPGTRIRAGPCKASDWPVSGGQRGFPPVHCEGCSRPLDSGMLGNAVGNLAQ